MKTSASEAVGFASLGLSAPLVSAVSALGYEEPTPIQREAIPVLLVGQRHARPGRDRHRQDGGVRAAAARCAVEGRQEPRQGARPGPGADARAGDAGRGGAAQVREGLEPQRRAGLRRRADGPPDSRAAPRHRGRGRHAGPRARSPAAAHARSRRGAGAGARRSRRDARHGLLRGHRCDRRRDAGHAADRALCRDVRAAHHVDRRPAPEEPEEGADRAGEARRRQAPAGPAGRLHRRQGPEDRGARIASSISRARSPRSSSAARASKSTSSPTR